MSTTLCNVCEKPVTVRNSISCFHCKNDIHLKCNDLNYVDSQIIKKLNKFWCCSVCCKEIFPFTAINNYQLHSLLSCKRYCDIESTDTCLILKPPKNLTNLFNELNNLSPENTDILEDQINCKYYDIDQLTNIKSLNFGMVFYFP